MVKNNFMSEDKMVVRLAFQLLETMKKMTEAFEQLAKRPAVVNNYY